MRTVQTAAVTEAVKEMCIEANHRLSEDMCRVFEKAVQEERAPLGRQILEQLAENLNIAQQDMIPICQDTGMAVIFLEVGQDVHFEGGNIEEAVNEGVRRGYVEGYLRKSVVSDPLIRENTKDNTPAVIHYNIVPGDKFEIHISPKGFGSENKSQLKMLTPSQGEKGVKDYVVQVVSEAGANPCPPIIVGVGIGGTMERCAFLAKKALLRPVGEDNPAPHLAAMEKELLERINKLGIGPAGFGGDTTALDVHIEAEATHIAGLPVAVNIGCHATRHASGEL